MPHLLVDIKNKYVCMKKQPGPKQLKMENQDMTSSLTRNARKRANRNFANQVCALTLLTVAVLFVHQSHNATICIYTRWLR